MPLERESIQYTFNETIPSLPSIMHDKKVMLFNYMTDSGKKLDDTIVFTRCTMREPLSRIPLSYQPTAIESISGHDKGYQFHRSSSVDSHWIVNFSDTNFLGYIESRLFAQEEYLATCLPGLYPAKHHVMNESPEFFKIGENKVMLVEGAKLYGTVDTSSKIERLQSSLYGNMFVCAHDEEIKAHVSLEEDPYTVNMAAIVAPFCRGNGKTYVLEDVNTLLLQAYTGMKAIKEAEPSIPITVETGNWGCGAFGNNAVLTNIAQMVGATSAGIEKLIFYPREKEEEYEKALMIFEGEILPKISDGSLKTLEELALYLHTHAVKYGLTYGQSNGT